MAYGKVLLATLVAVATLWGAGASATVLDTVKQRGVLNCGTDNTAPGFGYLNTKIGKIEGLDADFCRAMAAAVLGDAAKVNFVVVTDKSRFNALQTGQVDVVFAHTTVKPVRESAIAIDFLPINFYDGTGVMVKAASGVKSVSELDGAAICTTQGSGTESTLAGVIRQRGFKNTKVLTFENLEKLFAALQGDRCNALSTDKSALAAWRGNSANPAFAQGRAGGDRTLHGLRDAHRNRPALDELARAQPVLRDGGRCAEHAAADPDRILVFRGGAALPAG